MTPTAQPTHIPPPTETYPGPYTAHDFGNIQDIGSFGGESIAFFHDGTLYEVRANSTRENIIIESFADSLDADSAATVVADIEDNSPTSNLAQNPLPTSVAVVGTTLYLTTALDNAPTDTLFSSVWEITDFPDNPSRPVGGYTVTVGYTATITGAFASDGSRLIGYFQQFSGNVVLADWTPLGVLPATIYGTIDGLSGAASRGLLIYDGNQLIIGVVSGNTTRFYSINDLNNPQALLLHTANRAYESMSYDPVNNRIYLTGRSGFLGRRTVYVTNAP